MLASEASYGLALTLAPKYPPKVCADMTSTSHKYVVSDLREKKIVIG